MSIRRLRAISLPFLGWLILILGFELLARIVVADEFLFPPPSKVGVELVSLLRESNIWFNLGATLRDTLIAAAIAVTLGIPTGLIIGTSNRARTLLSSPIDWFRSVPATAIYPVFFLFLGIGPTTRIALAAYGGYFAVLMPTMYGAANSDVDRRRHWSRLGFTKKAIFYHIVFWEALPSMLSGVRLAISSALVLVVVGEMFIGSIQGLGFLIMHYQTRYQIDAMYATIVLVGFAGWLLNHAFLVFERRFYFDSPR